MVLAAQADGLTAGKGHKGRDIRDRGKEGERGKDIESKDRRTLIPCLLAKGEEQTHRPDQLHAPIDTNRKHAPIDTSRKYMLL